MALIEELDSGFQLNRTDGTRQSTGRRRIGFVSDVPRQREMGVISDLLSAVPDPNAPASVAGGEFALGQPWPGEPMGTDFVVRGHNVISLRGTEGRGFHVDVYYWTLPSAFGGGATSMGSGARITGQLGPIVEIPIFRVLGLPELVAGPGIIIQPGSPVRVQRIVMFRTERVTYSPPAMADLADVFGNIGSLFTFPDTPGLVWRKSNAVVSEPSATGQIESIQYVTESPIKAFKPDSMFPNSPANDGDYVSVPEIPPFHHITASTNGVFTSPVNSEDIYTVIPDLDIFEMGS